MFIIIPLVHVDTGRDERFQHFNILLDVDLFHKVNSICDVINIEANLYFNHLLLGEHFGEASEHLSQVFPRPFKDIATILFRPAAVLLQYIYQ